MMSDDEDGTSDIGVEHFKSGVDDFEEYVELFEAAVNLATRATSDAEKQQAYWEWLPLRLDKPARAILTRAKEQVQAQAQALDTPRDATWSELREALKILLIDPQEERRWHMKLMTVEWDGIESLHAFASRVIMSVNKFDKKFDEAYRTREYFLRFRMGLPKNPYQDAIDMNVSFEDGTIDKAMIIALRAQLTQSNQGENQYKQVSFDSVPVPASYENMSPSDQCVPTAAHGDHARSGAPIHLGAPRPELNVGPWICDSRTLNIDSSLASINARLEDLDVGMRSGNSRLTALENDMDGLKRGAYSNQWNNPYLWPSQSHYPQPYQNWPNPQYHQGWPNQQYLPNAPHSQNPPYSSQNDTSYEHRGEEESCRAIDTGDEASGYDVDPEVEVDRLSRALEEAKAKARAKQGGYR